MNCILGIDPGLSGALCLYQCRTGPITVLDIPTIEVRVAKSLKRQIDLYALGNWLDMHRNLIKVAIIEQVGSMPAQGVTSSFNFGFTAGAIQGLVAANAIPMTLVRPQVWKSAFGLLRQDKDASRQAASRIAPQFSHHWHLKKHDGRAEAFLLAVYGSKLT